MIIQSQYNKDANTKWHKKLANVNVGISLKTGDCEDGLTDMQGNLMSG
jgi:hypothetical protein